MQFITDNYIWFLIGGIVLLMVIIGYIAEKTDFGHKDVGKKEKKDKKKEKELKKLEKSNLKLNDVVYTDNNVEVIEDLEVPLNENKQVEEISTPLNIEEDLTVPLNGNKQIEEITTPINIEEDLTVPLNGLPNEPENIEIEETLKDNEEVKTTDDVWKF